MLIDAAHAVALEVLADNRDILDRLAAGARSSTRPSKPNASQAIFADVRMWDAGSSDVAARAHTPSRRRAARAPSRKHGRGGKPGRPTHRGGTT